ncbi:MAG: hypothetical protein DHS20C06_07240 [Hyphobacterium sp.]|nr:MAG: hypothetical protein DHS20C06_07240 [Hyphobacterium sp.]
MHRAILVCIASALTTSCAQFASESEPANIYLSDFSEVTDFWFDPRELFTFGAGYSPTVYVQYTGDDYDFPVYAFALSSARHPDRENHRDERVWFARMNRSPAADGDDPFVENYRPRLRGINLLRIYSEQLADRQGRSRQEILAALPVEQYQANSYACPGMWDQIAAVRDADWFEEDGMAIRYFTNTEADYDNIIISVHADRMNIEFDRLGGNISFEGMVPRTGTVAGWANELVAALESCWRPLPLIASQQSPDIDTSDDEEDE